ncbi:glycosyltransferase family 2 protein [Cytophagales bacterium LB-30]|uniref:Glycosyltransferase family 2 protein n=1 Tax=Shiella aurantiaca TaxID=3058365 RepID=A0ABT8F2E5_9BACT|nr:glycosyltransferase family 2 protein [Shiella aurantiaca]MDN4164411.1 glycosyltransferase family 2 protein [Shiella aurantiaca]
MPKVAVVILNYNGKQHLATFLPSVLQHSAEAEIIVADNGSTDDSLSFLASSFPNVTCIALDKNYGFCGGYNRALAQVEAEYFVLLNSDVEVSAGWLNPLIQGMEQNPEMGACQPKILSYQQKTHFEYAGAAGGYLDTLGYPFCRGRIFDVLEEDKGQYDAPAQIFWATGACLCIRANLYKKLGGLDESFFAHMEEIDLCWRLQNHGYQVWCLPQSVVYHLGGGTLAANNPRKTYLNFRNSLSVLLKNLPGNKLYKILVRLALDELAVLQQLIKGRPAHAWAIIKADIAFVWNLKNLLQKRGQAKGMKETSPGNSFLLWEFYWRRNKKFSDWKN